MGHAHLGGKTVLYLIDGLYSGVHSVDIEPRRWNSPPFQGQLDSELARLPRSGGHRFCGTRLPQGRVE